MIYDLQNTDQAPQASYDVIVCGSGPAGMTIARKLAAHGKRVLLLEAGGFDYSAQSQAIYEGQSVGETYYGVESCRLRYFGGTSGHWAGLCGVFDPLDFAARDIWDLPGWPISHAQAYEHIDEAKHILDLRRDAFSERGAPAEFGPTITKAGLSQSPPTRFGDKYRDELQKAELIDVFLNANVTGLALSPDGKRISSLRVQNYAGRSFDIAAPFVALCFGALENARFLLNADQRNNGAFSAQTDFIGRCFMEHFNVGLGRFALLDTAFWRDRSKLELALAADMAAKAGIGSTVIAATPGTTLKFYGRLAPVRKFHRDVACSSPQVTTFLRRFSDFPCTGDGFLSTLMEQTPNRASRVQLAEKQDQFGLPQLSVDWRFSETDRKTMRETALVMGRAMAASDNSRLRIDDGVLEGRAKVDGHCHQMGTTRMSSSGATGVVDENCRVHGFENLYVGGSSVFPTGGGVNPTFTIVCLALRLGEHLAARLSKLT